jgi:hypothetical protein
MRLRSKESLVQPWKCFCFLGGQLAWKAFLKALAKIRLESGRSISGSLRRSWRVLLHI